MMPVGFCRWALVQAPLMPSQISLRIKVEWKGSEHYSYPSKAPQQSHYWPHVHHQANAGGRRAARSPASAWLLEAVWKASQGSSSTAAGALAGCCWLPVLWTDASAKAAHPPSSAAGTGADALAGAGVATGAGACRRHAPSSDTTDQDMEQKLARQLLKLRKTPARHSLTVLT